MLMTPWKSLRPNEGPLKRGGSKMTMIQGLKLKRHDFSNKDDPCGAPKNSGVMRTLRTFFWCVDLPGKTSHVQKVEGKLSWQWQNDRRWEDLTGTRSDRLLFVNGALPGRVGSDERKWLILPIILYISIHILCWWGEELCYGKKVVNM